MIFVTVGTNEAPFDRLLRALDGLGAGEELVVQRGSSAVCPAGATCIEFLPFDALVEYVRAARAVVTHAGVGSVMTTLANGKRPLVVPRLHRHGEAVDDHQLAFGRRLHQAGLVVLVEDPLLLPEALAAPEEPVPGLLRADERLVAELRGYLVQRTAESAAS